MAMELPYQAITDLAREGSLNVRVDGVFNCNDVTREQDYAFAVANRGKTDVEHFRNIYPNAFRLKTL